ncbi:response regulator [Paraflavisolibacter sp. H34]|uniref:response regulator n=1 Tax=Huijunlia imazamoxiresistens TaxID=3127457 RepID=UPI00301B228A
MNCTHCIFLIDDDADDREALRDALQEAGSTQPVVESRDGLQALELLQGMKGSGQLPCLIVLDVNMPRMDGRQTLLALQADSALSAVPVVMFSTSSLDSDLAWFAQRNVPFITKPHDFSGLIAVATRFLGYCAQEMRA